MPPVRRSLRDRNRTAIEQPYQSGDGQATQTGHPDTSGEPAPAVPGRGGGGGTAPEERAAGGTGPAGESEPSRDTAKPSQVAPGSGDEPDPSQGPSATPSSVPSSSVEAVGGTPARSGGARRTGARKGRDGAAQAAREGDSTIPVARILYLPEDLIEPLRIYRATNGLTNTQVALRALNATYRQIPDLLEREPRRQVITGDLFDEVIPIPTRSNRQVEITPTAAQLDTIDPLVKTTGANDRSHLFALAIRQFLTDAGLIQP